MATPVPAEVLSPGLSIPPIPPEAAAGVRAVLDDLAERPQYYLNVSGVLLGITLSITVLSATVATLDGFPIISDAFRVIGLAYVFWFLGKFLLNGKERQRLQTEIDEFVEVVRGDPPSSAGLLAVAREERIILNQGETE